MRHLLLLAFLLIFAPGCNRPAALSQAPADQVPVATALFPQKEQIEALAAEYRTDNGIPALSVAIMRKGKLVYSGGFGMADVSTAKPATGESVYLLASISKLFGGTLAAKLEAEGQLRDETIVNLDLSKPTRDYIDLPANGHTHTVAQLTAHLGCVPHYGGSSTPNGHFATAAAAVKQLNNDPTLSGCAVGQNYNYSTHAFPYLGGVLEKVTRRSVARLVEEEIADAYQLPSVKVMYREKELRPNPNRVSIYGNAGNEINYEENSWKVFGGGIEANAIDIARFTHLINVGRIVDADTRENRLWKQLAPESESPYGISWRLGEMDGIPVAEHSGSARGSRTHVRLYRDAQDPLIICVLTNGGITNFRPEALVTEMGKVIRGK